jgi:hypothetical protein
MARQQIERLDFADRSGMTYLRMDQKAGSCFDAGFYFEFCESCRRMTAAIVRTGTAVIRSPDYFFGSYASAASFTPVDLRFVWVAIAGVAGLAALLPLGWNELRADRVSTTEGRAYPSSSAAAPQVETQAERMDAIRRRGLELLGSVFPEDELSPPLPRGDRLEIRDATIKPLMRIATAGEVEDSSVAAPAPLPAVPAASKPAEAKEKHAVQERPARRGHPWRASRHHRDRVRMARAAYVQVAGEPQKTLADGLQADRAPPEENKAFDWVRRLPDAIAPSSWQGGWENLWAKGNGGGGSSCRPSVIPAMVCPREAHVGSQ